MREVKGQQKVSHQKKAPHRTPSRHVTANGSSDGSRVRGLHPAPAFFKARLVAGPIKDIKTVYNEGASTSGFKSRFFSP